MQQNVFLHLSSVKMRRAVAGLQRHLVPGNAQPGDFLILVATGIPLMLYYHPSVPQAYADMKDLQFVVSAGVFLRNLHRWSAHAMVLLVFAHMFKVFYRGAYRPPREFNWVIGVVLLLVTLFLSYTGYLLPWDQLAFWAITVGSNIMSAVPVLGQKMRFLMLGGNTVNANALLRFYVLHCVILPLAAILFIGDSLLAHPQGRRTYIPGRQSPMSEPKKFEAALDSDSRNAPVRVAFVTRRTSPQVKAKDDALRDDLAGSLVPGGGGD